MLPQPFAALSVVPPLPLPEPSPRPAATVPPATGVAVTPATPRRNEARSRSPLSSPRVGRRRNSLRPVAVDPDDEARRDEVKVVVRVRPPMEPGRSLSYFADEADQTKLLSTPVDLGIGSPTARSLSVEELSFSRVIAPHEDNHNTFEGLGLKEVVAGVACGFQETIFAYGQTGSGKTHTILGNASGEPGLLQLCTCELLNLVLGGGREREGVRTYVQLMCLEIKNEDVIDLLPEQAESVAAQSCQVTRETISVKGRRNSYCKVTVWNYHEAMLLLRGAIASREVGSSSVNSESSRSHMVVRFTVKTFGIGCGGCSNRDGTSVATTPTDGDGTACNDAVVGSLTLVDLAGNEREGSLEWTQAPGNAGAGASASGASPQRGGGTAARKEEAKAINVSLTHLNRMLVKMQNGELDESDRRQSSLNMVLYESLVEDCGVTMVFCIHPDRRYALAARSTLQMALRCRRIVQQKQVRRIEAVGYQESIQDLRVEASALTRAHSEALAARTRKEVELRDTESMLEDLKYRYEVKSKDYDALRLSLEAQYRRLSEEGREKRQLVVDLNQKQTLLQGVIEQLQQRETELADLQRRYEEACRSGTVAGGAVPPTAPDNSIEARLLELERARIDDKQGFELCKKELAKAYNDQVASLRESYEKQLQWQQRELFGLQEKLQQRELLEPLKLKGNQASPLQSSSGEPCSEPSMYSNRSREAGGCLDAAFFADDHELLRSSSPREESTPDAPLEGDGSHKYNNVAAFVKEVASPLRSGRGRRLLLQIPPRLPNAEGHAGNAGSMARVPGDVSASSSGTSGNSASSYPDNQSCASGGITKAERALWHFAPPWEPAAVEGALSQLCRMALQAKLPAELRRRCFEAAVQAMQHLPRSLRTQRDGAKLVADLLVKEPSLKEAPAAQDALSLAVGILQALPSLCVASVEAEAVHIAAAPASSSCAAPVTMDAGTAAEACTACFSLLAVLCQKDRGWQKSVRLAGGPDAAVRCLGTPTLCAGSASSPTRADASVHGCWLLMALCNKNNENQDVVRKLGGISLLLQLLEREVKTLAAESCHRPLDATRLVGPASATLCAYIVGCIASLAEGNRDNQQAFHNANGMHFLLHTLETCLQSPHVVSNACVAIAHVAHRHEKNQAAARLNGGIQIVLGALLAYRGHAAVQGGICRTVAELADNNRQNQEALLQTHIPDGTAGRQANAVSLLLQSLSVAHEDEPLATTACWALANLVASQPAAMEQVRQRRGLETIVALLRRFQHEERTCEYLCRLLSELARGESGAAHQNRWELQSQGTSEVITAVIRHHAQSQGFVLVHARDAVKSIQDVQRFKGQSN